MERKCKKLIKNMKDTLKLDGGAASITREESGVAPDEVEQTRHDSKTHTAHGSGSGA